MGFLSHLFWPYGLIAQGLALLHFFRRRPDTYWVYIILFGGPIGAAIYMIAEVIPDVAMLGRQGAKGSSFFARRKRMAELERSVEANPSAANFEDLGILLMESGKFARAREMFDRAIAQRSDTLDAFYRRGVCAMELNDATAALPDLARVVAAQPGYDFDRAGGLLAQAYALVGERSVAEEMFARVTARSVLSETYLNYADLLESLGRTAEARAWAQKVLEKKSGMLRYQRRRERKWFRRASALLRKLPM